MAKSVHQLLAFGSLIFGLLFIGQGYADNRWAYIIGGMSKHTFQPEDRTKKFTDQNRAIGVEYQTDMQLNYAFFTYVDSYNCRAYGLSADFAPQSWNFSTSHFEIVASAKGVISRKCYFFESLNRRQNNRTDIGIGPSLTFDFFDRFEIEITAYPIGLFEFVKNTENIESNDLIFTMLFKVKFS